MYNILFINFQTYVRDYIAHDQASIKLDNFRKSESLAFGAAEKVDSGKLGQYMFFTFWSQVVSTVFVQCNDIEIALLQAVLDHMIHMIWIKRSESSAQFHTV